MIDFLLGPMIGERHARLEAFIIQTKLDFVSTEGLFLVNLVNLVN